jgi:hypothetical protein
MNCAFACDGTLQLFVYMILPSMVMSSTSLFLSGFLVKTLYAFFISLLHATSAHFIFPNKMC